MQLTIAAILATTLLTPSGGTLLNGTVTCPSGNPLQVEAVLRLTDHSPGIVDVSRSHRIHVDESGLFSVNVPGSGLMHRTYSLEVLSANMARAKAHTNTIEIEATTKQLHCDVVIPGNCVHGRLYNSLDGAPADEVEVHLVTPENAVLGIGKTISDGSIGFIDVPDGKYRLQAGGPRVSAEHSGTPTYVTWSSDTFELKGQLDEVSIVSPIVPGGSIEILHVKGGGRIVNVDLTRMDPESKEVEPGSEVVYCMNCIRRYWVIERHPVPFGFWLSSIATPSKRRVRFEGLDPGIYFVSADATNPVEALSIGQRIAVEEGQAYAINELTSPRKNQIASRRLKTSH